MDRLPTEIFDELCSWCDFASLKNIRLVYKNFAALGAEHVFGDVHVFVLPESLDKLDNICGAEHLRRHVRHIYCWGPLFQEGRSFRGTTMYRQFITLPMGRWDRSAYDIIDGTYNPTTAEIQAASANYIRYWEREREVREGGRYRRSLAQAIRVCNRLRTMAIPWELRSIPQTQAVCRASRLLQKIRDDTLASVGRLEISETYTPRRAAHEEMVFSAVAEANSVISMVTVCDKTLTPVLGLNSQAGDYQLGAGDPFPPEGEDLNVYLAVCHRIYFETELQHHVRSSRRRGRIPPRTLSTGDQPMTISPPYQGSLSAVERAALGTFRLWNHTEQAMHIFGGNTETYLIRQLTRDGWPLRVRSLELRGLGMDADHIIALVRHHAQTLEEFHVEEVILNGGDWIPVFEVLRNEVPNLRHSTFEGIIPDEWGLGLDKPPPPLQADVFVLLNAYLRGDRHAKWAGLLRDYWTRPLEVVLRRYPEYQAMPWYWDDLFVT